MFDFSYIVANLVCLLKLRTVFYVRKDIRILNSVPRFGYNASRRRHLAHQGRASRRGVVAMELLTEIVKLATAMLSLLLAVLKFKQASSESRSKKE